MNDRDAGLLYDLQGEMKLLHERGELVGVKAVWFRPLDLGGGDGTHHSQTLRRLVKKGWAELAPRSNGHRGSNLYRITLAGVKALANRQATLSVGPAAVGRESPSGRTRPGA